LQHARLPREFWAELVSTVYYVQKLLPIASLGALPFERLNGKMRNIYVCLVAPFLKLSPYRRKMEAGLEKTWFASYQKGAKVCMKRRVNVLLFIVMLFLKK